MKPEAGALVAAALNLLGEAAFPQRLATLRRMKTDAELTDALAEAIRTCVEAFGKVIGPEGTDVTRANQILEELLHAPVLLQFQDPILLGQRLRLAIQSLGFELPEPDAVTNG